jgi:hypothetical protein
MADWLTYAQAVALVEARVAAEDAAWMGAVDAATEYVEDKRKDLFTGVSPDPVVFGANGSIKYGTALLANRWYTRRKSPLGSSQNVEFGGTDFLRQDPDIAKLLGIGIEGKFAFGAARPKVTEEVL